jgi:hypothetical protein
VKPSFVIQHREQQTPGLSSVHGPLSRVHVKIEVVVVVEMEVEVEVKVEVV